MSCSQSTHTVLTPVLACGACGAQAGDLKRQLRKARERQARFDERVIWKYFSQIAKGACTCLLVRV